MTRAECCFQGTAPQEFRSLPWIVTRILTSDLKPDFGCGNGWRTSDGCGSALGVAGEGGELATEEEAERLEKILKSFPTTEEEDLALLESE